MEVYNLFDIAYPKQWKTISSKEFDANGKYSVYGANGIIGKTNLYNHEEETVLITCRGATCGTVNLSKPFSYINGNAMALDKLDKSKAITKYIYYFFQNYNFKNVITGSAQPQITRESLKKVEIPLPDLETQNKIVAILDKAKVILDKRERTIALYDELLRATFLEMFGDPVRNEKGWDKVRLEEIGEIQGGLQVTTKRSTNPLKLPYLRVANVYRNYLSLDEIKTILVTPSEAVRARLEKGDILIVEGHGNINEVGRSAVWDGSIENCLHQNHLIRVRLKKSFPFYTFINYYLNTSGGREQMLKVGKTTSGLNTISSKNVKEIQVITPPVELLNKFEKISHKRDSLNYELSAFKKKAEYLLNALSQLAFKGELKLNTAVALEVLLENDYEFFKENSSEQSIQLLLDRLDKSELNDKKFYEPEIYDKAQGFAFELLKEGKIKQVFDEKTQQVKLSLT